MIRILADPNKLIPHTEEAVLENIADYTGMYESILHAIQSQKDLTLYVNNNTVIQWFRNMAERYHPGTFTFETIEARHHLEQLWQVSIPSSVSDDEIIQAGLLSLEISPQPGLQFIDILLSHFYTPILTARTFPFSKITALLLAFDQSKWQANSNFPLIVRLYRERLQSWREQVKTSEQRQFIDLFESNPQILYDKLVRYKVLQSYKEIGHPLLGDFFDLFETLKLNLIDLPVDEAKIKDVITQVSYVLNSYVVENHEDLETFISNLSGELTIEFDSIEKILLNNPEWVSEKIIVDLENKCETLGHRLEHRISYLRNLIRPDKPGSPNSSWKFDEMLEWAVQKYLPYQAWCDEQDKLDGELFQVGEQFAQWYYDNWHVIRSNSQRMVFNILPNKAIELKKTNRINLILVVDNLGWSFAEKLKVLFHAKGFFLTAAEPYLSMLPTETEISKKCLLSGAVGYTSIDNKTYKAITEKGWVPYFNDVRFRYISDIGGLDQIDNLDAITYVVNYLAVDKALHTSSNQIGIPHSQHVHHLLEKLVERVENFVTRHNIRDKIRIYIVSDHGSTRIPSEIANDLDMNYFKTNEFVSPSPRYIGVTNKKFSELPDNLQADCFFLNLTDFGNNLHYLCGRRANRFLPTDREIYVHGGLLPEETIIPCLVFEAAKITVQNLTLILKKTEFRYRLETIELEIGNPNDFAVEGIQVSTLNTNVDMSPQTIPWLNGKNKTTLQIKAHFKLTLNPDEQTLLVIRIRFNCRGEKIVQDIKVNIIMRKMVEEKGKSVFDGLE